MFIHVPEPSSGTLVLPTAVREVVTGKAECINSGASIILLSRSAICLIIPAIDHGRVTAQQGNYRERLLRLPFFVSPG